MKFKIPERFTMQFRPLALGALLCADVGGVAAAQQVPQQTGKREVHGSAVAETVYETNFARSSKALAATRGVEPEETTFRPSVRLDVAQPIGQQLIFLNGSAGYDFHRRNPQLDRKRYDALAGYLTTAGPCRLSVTQVLRASQSDLGSIDSILAADARNELTTIGPSTEVNCGRQTGIAFGATVQRLDSKNSAKSQKLADTTLETLGLQIGYNNPTLGNFAVIYSYSSSEFPNRIIPGRPIGDGYFTEGLGLSVERRFGTGLNVSGNAMRTRLKREFSPVGTPQKLSSTTYSADASYKLGKRLKFELQGAREITPSQRAGKLFDVTTSGQISGRYSLGSRYQLEVGYDIKDVKSNVDTLSTRAVVTNSRTNSVYGSVRYRQSDKASLVLDLRHEDRNTNLPAFDFSSMSVGLSAEVGF